MIISGVHAIAVKPVNGTPYHLAYDATEIILSDSEIDNING